MDDQEKIELLIDKKISNAKLEVAEKTLNHYFILGGALLTIFGVVMPILFSFRLSENLDKEVDLMKQQIKLDGNVQTLEQNNQTKLIQKDLTDFKSNFKEMSEQLGRQSNSNSQRTEQAIKNIKESFEKLSGEQLRKPKLQCLYNKKELEGQEIPFPILGGGIEFTVQIINSGDKSASSITTALYVQDSTNTIFDLNSQVITSDEKKYNLRMNQYQITNELQAKNTTSIHFSLQNLSLPEYPVLLKIFYGDVEPYRVKFSFVKK